MPSGPAASQYASPEVEAARYALLRRLAPSMRHHLVVNLQPIGMIYEVMDRRLRAPEPNLTDVHDSAQKINGFARAALASSLDIVSWLAANDEAVTTAADGVRECLGLITTSLTFRGFAVRNQAADAPGSVHRAAIRNVLTGALIHVTDVHPAPADLLLMSESRQEGLALTLTLKPTDGEQGFTPVQPYRVLQWSDLEALALSENVKLTREGAQQITLSLPWAAVPAQ